VDIGGQRYFIETNFNQNGSPSPVALIHDEVVQDVGPRQRRLVHSPIPIGDTTQSDKKWWRLQIRETSTSHWMDVYCFTEVEWLPLDFEIMSAGMGSLGGGWFTKLIVCFRLLLEDDIPVGYSLILGNELISSYKGKTQVLQKFYSEADRVACLEEEFGVTLSDEEQAAIEGTCTELVQESFDFYG
jgi:arylamine N-acetyltransferase